MPAGLVLQHQPRGWCKPTKSARSSARRQPGGSSFAQHHLLSCCLCWLAEIYILCLTL